MLKWSIVLYGLDIIFVRHTAIKAHAIADFLAEHSFLDKTATPEEEPKSRKLDTWSIKVDGVVNSKGVGIGMVMTSPHGKYEGSQSIKLDSHLSNNQAEYEVLIIGMVWALTAGIQALKLYSDSHVVVSQINNEFIIH